MHLTRIQALETIKQKPQSPWQTPAYTVTDIEPDHEKDMDQNPLPDEEEQVSLCSPMHQVHTSNWVL
jgi:hypothetical protein